MKQLESTALLFKALSEPVRLRILNLLLNAEREICVCELIEVLDIPQSVISRHLAYLRKVALVHTRREGVWMHYSINPVLVPPADALLNVLMTYSKQNPLLSADQAKLCNASCS